jgi:hypothetical protein
LACVNLTNYMFNTLYRLNKIYEDLALKNTTRPFSSASSSSFYKSIPLYFEGSIFLNESNYDVFHDKIIKVIKPNTNYSVIVKFGWEDTTFKMGGPQFAFNYACR